MHFYKVASTDIVVRRLVQTLASALQANKQVLWLVSGGSVVPIAVAALQQLNEQGLATSKLTVMLADERFGPVGHAESNWRQLEVAGFDMPTVHGIPVLQGKSADETRLDYEVALAAALDAASVRIGLFGIGADGHTAGILPHSSAATTDDTPLVVAYQADDYLRLTISGTVLAALDTAIVYAAGSQKQQALEALEKGTATVQEQPSALLARAKQVDIYNDFVGGEI